MDKPNEQVVKEVNEAIDEGKRVVMLVVAVGVGAFALGHMQGYSKGAVNGYALGVAQVANVVNQIRKSI